MALLGAIPGALLCCAVFCLVVWVGLQGFGAGLFHMGWRQWFGWFLVLGAASRGFASVCFVVSRRLSL